MAKQAIRPDFIVNRTQDEKKVSDEERHLYNLSQQKGWQIYTEFIERQIKSLKETNTQAIANGLSFEEIGRNMVVLQLAEEVIRKGLTKIQDAKEAIEQPDGTIR